MATDVSVYNMMSTWLRLSSAHPANGLSYLALRLFRLRQHCLRQSNFCSNLTNFACLHVLACNVVMEVFVGAFLLSRILFYA